MHSKSVKDHLGTTYPSITQMCKEYGIPLRSYNNRIGSGWDIKRILTTPVRKQGGRPKKGEI